MPIALPLALANTTDQDLSAEVNKMLRETRYAALQRIRYHVADGVVELSGDVPSFYFKQIAQEVLLSLHHVQGIENRLHVRCSP
jgi:osmotically-inducible protein OsmY